MSDGFRLLVLESSTETDSNENKNLRLDWSEKIKHGIFEKMSV